MAIRHLLPSARFTRLGSEMAWVVLGQTLAAVGGLVAVRVLTEVLTPDRYGEFALGITLGTLGQLVAWSPISGAVLRYFAPAQESSQLGAYLQAVRRLLVQATAGLVALGFVIVIALVALGATQWIALALAALLFTLLSGYESTLDSMQLAGRQRRIVAWHQGVNVWARVLMALVLLSVAGASSAMAMLGFAVGVLLVLVSQLFFFYRVMPFEKTHGPVSGGDASALARRMTQYAWPIAAWGVFSWAQAVSDRWILQAFTSTAVVGVYSVLNQLGFYPMSLFSAVTVQFVSPVLFERAGDGSDLPRLDSTSRLVLAMVVVTLAFTAMATVAASLLHRAIFAVLVDVRYRSVSGLLPWMVCAGGLFAAGQAASQVLMVAGLTKRLIAPKGAIAVVTLALYTLGAHLRGLDGIIYANTAFGILYFCWMSNLAWRWRTTALRGIHAPSPAPGAP
jgi:O-antigen/teichoic acid export membrane protein